MKLIIASNNAHKLVEIRAILGDEFEEILSMAEAGIDHETVEDGSTFLENAEKKAREIMEISGCCALADDSGLCVEALGGAPGIYSARFSPTSPAPWSWCGRTAAWSGPRAGWTASSPTRRPESTASATIPCSICRSGAAPTPSSCRRRKTPSATGPAPCTPWWPS